MQTLVGTSAILTDNHWVGRMVAMLVGHPLVEVIEGLTVPTVIDVPAHHVGHLTDTYLIIRITAMERHGAEAGRILSLDDILHAVGQCHDAVVVDLLLGLGSTGVAVEQQDLVHITPQNDAGVIVVLANHLAQVVLCILIVMRQVGHGVHGRHLFPHQDTQLVAHLQDGLVLWVVTDADKVGTHSLHEQHVAAVHLIGER